jgi:hypothetical protein
VQKPSAHSSEHGGRASPARPLPPRYDRPPSYRRRRAQGATLAELARSYGVGLSTISRLTAKRRVFNDDAHENASRGSVFSYCPPALDNIEGETDEFQLAQRIGSAIVFSALTVEVFINQEFGLHSETQKIIKEEKGLTLKAKWLLLPLLLQCNATFETGAMPFQKFSELVTLRNTIFHFNPTEPFDPQPKTPSRRFFSELVKDIGLARSYFDVVEKMITKLHELTGGKTELPTFLRGDQYLTSLSIDSNALVDMTGF